MSISGLITPDSNTGLIKKENSQDDFEVPLCRFVLQNVCMSDVCMSAVGVSSVGVSAVGVSDVGVSAVGVSNVCMLGVGVSDMECQLWSCQLWVYLHSSPVPTFYGLCFWFNSRC